MIVNCISVSGGKDSTALALLARETCPPESLRFVFADTGNEHEATYEYIDYLASALGFPIHRVRGDFSDQIARKRTVVDRKWRADGVPDELCDKVIAALVPTGNPFLDLCLWKGRFPSTQKRFCTSELKTLPIASYQFGLMTDDNVVWSWHGVRAEESPSRAAYPPHEQIAPQLFIDRPILRWKAADCFEAMRYCGIEPNPLYRLGMGRVGCMPCIMTNKGELLEISKRFPGHIARIEAWEAAVTAVSKHGADIQAASFFPDPLNQRHLRKRGIRAMVSWAATSYGGKQFTLESALPAVGCVSRYEGLCE